MGFNYAKEKMEFEQQWAAVRKQYEEAGMSLDAIEELHDFDWDWFKSRRRYINHLADLSEDATVEVIQQASTETIPGDVPISSGVEQCHWLDAIEDERLLQKLVMLGKDDIDLLTRLAFDTIPQLKHPNILLLFLVSLSYRRRIPIGTFNQGLV